jgi:uncharacterized protein
VLGRLSLPRGIPSWNLGTRNEENENHSLLPISMRHLHLTHILATLRDYLEALYGDRLAAIILYGSQARDEATPHSDIDILVTLHDTFDYVTEVNRTTPFIADLCLDQEVLISVTFAPDRQFRETQTPFFMNLRREGIPA